VQTGEVEATIGVRKVGGSIGQKFNISGLKQNKTLKRENINNHNNNHHWNHHYQSHLQEHRKA
jgi:hypothetical protein